jgi:hypothetical protein
MSYRSDDPEWRKFKQNELEHELYWEERELEMEAKRKRFAKNQEVKKVEEEKPADPNL